MSTILDYPEVKIEYDPAKKKLTQTWIGDIDTKKYREAIGRTVRFTNGRDVKYIITDIKNQEHVDPADSQYAATAIPMLFHAGIKAMAFVTPNNPSTEILLRQFIETVAEFNIRAFNTLEEADAWLDSQTEETANCDSPSQCFKK